MDNETLEMDNSDGCTTLQICLIKWNCPLKIAKMVKFMLYLFYSPKKVLEGQIFGLGKSTPKKIIPQVHKDACM